MEKQKSSLPFQREFHHKIPGIRLKPKKLIKNSNYFLEAFAGRGFPAPWYMQKILTMNGKLMPYFLILVFVTLT